jgi:ketosteroid isomerase-like protein
MSTQSVAQALVDLCRQGKNFEAIDRYYADDIVSTEPVGNAQMPAVIRGKPAVRGKSEWWIANHEIHSASASAPMVGEGRFAVHFQYDVTNKPSGRRMQMSEVALYTVRGDKINAEEFFYHMPGT